MSSTVEATGLLLQSSCMAVKWSTFGPQLLLTIDREDSTSLRTQLERRGARRHPHRSPGRPTSGCRPREPWPAFLGLSRGIVQECYEQLAAEGYLVSPARLGHPGR